jgi:DNA-binding NarL/FixJ family response regulator
MQPVSLAIAEDNKMALAAVLEKLSPYQDIQVALVAGNGEELLSKLELHAVDLVLMDIEMPVMDGITATLKIRERFPACKTLMLTTFDDDDKIFSAILHGASGYLLKDEPAENIHRAIHDVLKGGAAMSPAIAFKTLQYVRTSQAAEGPGENNILSPREIEILVGLKDGLAYKQIADRLEISEGTVRKHVQNIYHKLQVNNKVSAINAAVQKRWI